MPGGGGWGDPFEREVSAVADDVLTEKITIDSARRDYGVVIDSETLQVDEAESVRLRAELRTRGR